MKNILLLFIVVISFVACKRKKAPEPQICFGKEVYKYKDTISVSNCSKNYTKMRWVLPDGTQSTTESIYFVAPSPGNYLFTLYISNADFVNEFKTIKYITVNP